MFINFWRAARWFILAGCIFVAGMVCAMFIKYPFDKIGDLATWIGAIFTGLAFAGTIWVASREQRDRYRDKMTLALVAADAALQEIYKTLQAFDHVSHLLGISSHVDVGPARLKECRDRLMTVANWANAELVALAPLGGRCASKLMSVSGTVKLIVKILDESPETVPGFDGPWRIAAARNAHDMLLLCEPHLRDAMAICRSASDKVPEYS